MKLTKFFVLTLVLLPCINLQIAQPEQSSSSSGAGDFYKMGRTEFLKFTPQGFQKAISDYEKALQADPNFAPAFAGLGEVYSFIGFYKSEVKEEYEEYFIKAYQNILQALKYGPNLVETQRALAVNYLHLSRENDAEAAAIRVLQLDPNDAESQYILWAANGKNPNDPVIRKALTSDPNLVMAHVELATAYFFKANNYKKAAEHYRKAVELANSPQLRNYLGTTLRSQGYYNQAVAEYLIALKQDPSYAAAQMNLGITLFYMNKFNESIDSLKKAISKNPNYPDGYFFIAEAYAKTNNPKLAMDYYKQFLDIVSNQDNYSGYISTAKKSMSKIQQ